MRRNGIRRGAQILDWSRAEVAVMRLSASSCAIEAIIRDLMDTRDGTTYFAGRVWDVGICYDLGGHHSPAGRSVRDFQLGNGDRVTASANGRGLPLDSTSDVSLMALVARWGCCIDYVAQDATDALGAKFVLVRPDGVTAWATGKAADLGEAAFIVARWLGKPTQHVSP
jgi:hypothetical protein